MAYVGFSLDLTDFFHFSFNCAPNLVATVDDPGVEVVHEKRRGKLVFAKAALKLNNFQEIKKLKPVVVRRTSNRNSKKTNFF